MPAFLILKDWEKSLWINSTGGKKRKFPRKWSSDLIGCDWMVTRVTRKIPASGHTQGQGHTGHMGTVLTCDSRGPTSKACGTSSLFLAPPSPSQGEFLSQSPFCPFGWSHFSLFHTRQKLGNSHCPIALFSEDPWATLMVTILSQHC